MQKKKIKQYFFWKKAFIWSQWRRSGVLVVNFEHISRIALVFLLLTLNKQMSAGYFNNVNTWSQLFRDFNHLVPGAYENFIFT